MTDKPLPKVCEHCNLQTTPSEHWIKRSYRKDKWIWWCKKRQQDYAREYHKGKKQDAEYLAANRRRSRESYYNNIFHHRYLSYKATDRKRGWLDQILSEEDAIARMKEPCYYCTETPSYGLDRKDSSLGHSLENVVACCEKCNHLLSDIPFQAKEVIRPALEEIQEKKLLESWIIPTKRNRSRSKR